MAYHRDIELSNYQTLQKPVSTASHVYEQPQTLPEHSPISEELARNQQHQPMNCHCKLSKKHLIAELTRRNKPLTIVVIGSIAFNVLLVICLTVIAVQSHSEKQELTRLIDDTAQLIMDLHVSTVKDIKELLTNSTEVMITNISQILSNGTDSIIQLIDSHMKNTDSVDQKITRSFDTAINSIETNAQNTISLTNVVNALSAAAENSGSEIIRNMENILKASNNQRTVLLRSDSCQEIKDTYPNSTSGYYTVNGEKMYCELGELCGSEGGWTRLAYLDMTDTKVSCPSTLSYKNSSDIRACARPDSSEGSCASVQFPSNSISYSEVCGRVVGYQYGSPNSDHSSYTIDSYYLDGISITQGESPRKHIWSLIVGATEVGFSSFHCPCNSANSQPQSNVFGSDYFCESGNPSSIILHDKFFSNDPLWDGEQCGGNEANCCSAAGLPWFHKTLSTDTTDYLELRNCGDQHTGNENVHITFYEIYVK